MTAQALTPPRIGQQWPGQGGVYAGLIRGEGDQPDYYLIVANEEAEGLEFGGYGKTVDGTNSSLDGAANTQALITSEHAHPAAEWAAKHTADGHSDFYLPSRNELRLCYANAPEPFSKDDWYWSSTQDSAHYAWMQYFDDGYQGWSHECHEYRVRPVRRIQLSNSIL